MDNINFTDFLRHDTWFSQGRGPRYQQLARHIQEAIANEVLARDTQLPPERDMAEQADVSRVTIRKAIARLVAEGLVDQRQGSGSFIKAEGPLRLEQSLSTLVSFTEIMQSSGWGSSSRVLSAGLYPPTPKEIMTLGLSGAGLVARVKRLRLADPGPRAIETSALPQDVLPDPSLVQTSLYAVLRKQGQGPVRAIQKIAATNLSAPDADLLEMKPGQAVLEIERTGYNASGRPIELTSGVYRSDIYDFVTEVRLETD